MFLLAFFKGNLFLPSMSHPFGPNGPYFWRPCQRDRFPSLIDAMGVTGDGLVSSLGSSEIADMGSRMKRGRLSTCEAEKRATQAALKANLPPPRLYLRSTSRGWRRAIDIFMPRFQPDENMVSSEGDQWSEDQAKSSFKERLISVANNLQLPAAPRQVDELPYTGTCPHCQQLGSDDVKNDDRGRFMARRIFQNIDLL
ncbi:uncharacterized protein [Drosophila takahashii]|uniref:uncharacterized protein n=1 Tax=Drosophila takahashii TaxID=29030 RepID=UPI0007E7612A|nr:uncharacterized protein LOC108054608 [Drosophila takahashii]